MTSTRKPTRRNRNIGTVKSGHGQDNKLVVPDPRWDSRRFYERLAEHRIITRNVDGREFHFFVETTLRDFVHPCTVDDLMHVLRRVPAADLEGLNVFVLRQPKRKEQILSPVWGRLVYEAEYGEWTGPAVILEAQDHSKPILKSRSLDPETSRELDRLRLDGHRIVSTKREHLIEITLESTRATQLYRTLLHEVGHWVDWLRSVKQPAARAKHPEKEAERLEDLYFACPKSERESFAHRYADTLAEHLRHLGTIPFDRIVNSGNLEKDGLRMEDFLP